MMKKFCRVLVAIAIIGVGIGFYRGWFVVSSHRETESNKVDVNLTMDPDKVQADAESVKTKAQELTGQVKD